MKKCQMALSAAVTLGMALTLCALPAHAQKTFTCRDDAANTNLVSLIATPNTTRTSYTGFYQKTGSYLGKDTTTFQVYGYSASASVAYSQYDAQKTSLGGARAKFNSVVLDAVISPPNRTPMMAVTLSTSNDGKSFTRLPVKVNGPFADGGYNQIYTFSASNFKPARFLRFGVTQDPSTRGKDGKFYNTAAVGSVTLHGIKPAP